MLETSVCGIIGRALKLGLELTDVQVVKASGVCPVAVGAAECWQEEEVAVWGAGGDEATFSCQNQSSTLGIAARIS